MQRIPAATAFMFIPNARECRTATTRDGSTVVFGSTVEHVVTNERGQVAHILRHRSIGAPVVIGMIDDATGDLVIDAARYYREVK